MSAAHFFATVVSSITLWLVTGRLDCTMQNIMQFVENDAHEKSAHVECS